MKATLYTDGGARGNPGPAGIGYILELAEREPISHGEYIGEATNNQAEYQALLAGLARAVAEGVTEIECFLDSELLVKQIGGEYRVKNSQLRPLYDRVCGLVPQFERAEFRHVPREENEKADALVNEALDRALDKG